MNAEKKKETKRIIKFVLFSISAGVIELLAYTVCYELFGLEEWLSYLIGLVLSVIWNFTLNRKFTFQAANNVPVAMLKVAAFYLVFTPLTTFLEHYYTETLHWSGYIATALNMALNLSTEYLYDRFVVFREYLDTNDIAQKHKEEKSDE